ncbi:MAG: glycoside hydrolase family 2 protein [Pseudomonadales bacterium]
MTPPADSEATSSDVAIGVFVPLQWLDSPWEMVACEPGLATSPDRLPADVWAAAQPAPVPGTVASALRAADALPAGAIPGFDDHDYWYRCVFRRPDHDGPIRLVFHGLATLAEVWLDGTSILASENMFLSHEVDVTAQLAARPDDAHELVIRFASINQALAQRRPRARWRTALVAQRQLRHIRTSLLGRMPAMPPAWAPVGPWRPVALRLDGPARVETVRLAPSLKGSDGQVSAQVVLQIDDPKYLNGTVAMTLTVGDVSADLAPTGDEAGQTYAGHVVLPNPALWWPHTHGRPARYPATLRVAIGAATQTLTLAPVGFRRFDADRGEGSEFRLRINDTPIYCRGICWMPLDPASLCATREALRDALEALVTAGANMVRVSGVTTYESDDFYDLCDELGLLVWQDFMFACMDYPFGETAFRDTAEAEARQQLDRLGHRPSLTVLCGNSEVFQQPAMLGLPPDAWQIPWFEDDLAGICARARPDTVYVSGSPSGGTLPFHTDADVAHYFGVGAYRRPLADARLAEPAFASECLAFAVPPEPASLGSAETDPARVLRSPTYLGGIPRDNGADWDFAEVTEHYVVARYGAAAVVLKEHDPARYLDACRVTVGETMASVQRQWRRRGARCAGGLIWTGRDLVPGPGWGVFDCRGIPKAPYYFLKRTWAPQALLLLDEGLNGLWVHLVNERDRALEGTLEVHFVRANGVVTESARQPLRVAARDVAAVSVEQVIGGFRDAGQAYHFGAPAFDLVRAAFQPDEAVADDVADPALAMMHVGAHLNQIAPADLELTAVARPHGSGSWVIEIRSDSYAHAVALDLPGAQLSDNYFDLLPNWPKRLDARFPDGPRPAGGTVRALNGRSAVPITGLMAGQG